MHDKKTHVDGRVVDHLTGDGVSAAAVSDGVSVVRTDERGAFDLILGDSARFLFVSTPGQYTAMGLFYIPVHSIGAGKSVEFLLKPAPVGDRFCFAQLTDAHLSLFSEFKPSPRRLQPAEQIAVFTAAVREIANFKPCPQFIALTGDLPYQLNNLDVQRACEQIDFYVRARQQISLPAYDAIGNHDHALFTGPDNRPHVPQYGRGLFESRLGPTYYSFNCGKWHFVVLNTYDLKEGTLHYRMDEVQCQWLEADLEVAGKDTPTVVFMHEELPDLEDVDRLVALFGGYNIKAVVSGHFHSNLDYSYRGLRCLVTGALCAGWWWRDHWATPRGYGLFRVEGDNLDRFYAKCGDPNAVQIRHPESWSMISGDVELAAAVLEATGPPATVTCQIGDTDFVPMNRQGNGPWPLWKHTFNSADFPDGSVRLTIRTVNQYGRTETYHRHVVVKNEQVAIGLADGELLFTLRGSRGPSEVRVNGRLVGTVPHPTPEETEVRMPLVASLLHRVNVITFTPVRLTNGEVYDQFMFKDLRIRLNGQEYYRVGFRPHAFSQVRMDRDDPRSPRTVRCVIPPKELADSMVLTED